MNIPKHFKTIEYNNEIYIKLSKEEMQLNPLGKRHFGHLYYNTNQPLKWWYEKEYRLAIVPYAYVNGRMEISTLNRRNDRPNHHALDTNIRFNDEVKDWIRKKYRLMSPEEFI